MMVPMSFYGIHIIDSLDSLWVRGKLRVVLALKNMNVKKIFV